MAQNTTIPVPAGTTPDTAILLTNSNVTAARLQVQGGGTCYIQARAGTGSVTAPGAIFLRPDEGFASLTLSEAFAGEAGANRLYAWSLNGAQVSISHA